MVKQQILKDLIEVLEQLGLPTDQVSVERPTVSGFGDYTSNVALRVASNKQKPLEIAKDIEAKFPQRDYLKKVEAAEKGFLNFYLSNSFLQDQVGEILKNPWLFMFPGKSQRSGKARVELISANPTGPLHIGNARGGPIGDVLANVLEKSGYKVIREYYNNNVGGQVKALGATIKSLASQGVVLRGENQYQGEYIKEVAESLKGKIEGKSEEEIGQMATELLFKEILKDSEDMGIKFDEIYHESDLKEKAKTVVEKLKNKGVVKEKDGALWLAPNDQFLKDRETVIVKSDGSYTYFTDDITYHQLKLNSGADLIINILGSNHSGHVPRIKAAMSALGFEVGKFKFILYQYVRVKRGEEIVKMSKRAGNFVTAREVLEEVGKDAFRFFLLFNKPETHMDFDLELAKRHTEDNPVFYVQYAHARLSSILRKADFEDDGQLTFLTEKEELNLIRTLNKAPEIIEEISRNFSVHLLAVYSLELASEFHHFYEKVRVISDNKDKTQARLRLIKATQIILASFLELMGISAPERMG